jgi:hypothetical protein
VIEMFRGDAERGKFGPLYTSQWISIAILLAGVLILLLARRWKKGEPFQVFREDDMTVPEPEEADEAVPEAVSEESDEAPVDEA